MATAYGYDIQSESTVHLTATAPSAGTKYLFVYLEWDLSNPVEASGKIDIYDNGASSSWTPPHQDNLITNPIGVYQLPLYRLTVNTAGTVTATVNWKALGYTTIGDALYALYSGRATNADAADYASGNTDKTLANHLTAIYSRLDSLGFKKGSVDIDGATLTKMGKYAILHIPAGALTATMTYGLKDGSSAYRYKISGSYTMSFTAAASVTLSKVRFYAKSVTTNTNDCYPTITISGTTITIYLDDMIGSRTTGEYTSSGEMSIGFEISAW